MAQISKPLSNKETRELGALFFFFGLGVMCLAPRLPEIKANLDISIGQFGTLMGTASIGAIFSLLSMGHVVHRVGVYKVLIASTLLLYISLGIMVHVHSVVIFLFLNILTGVAWSSYHIAVNAQAIHRQNESEKMIIPLLHGLWTAGALSTAVIAALVTSFLSLYWHIDILVTVLTLSTLVTIYRLKPILIQGSDIADGDVTTLRQMAKSFSIDWVISIGFLFVVSLEILVADWSSILATKEMKVNSSLAVIPYILFMAAMILGRVGFTWLLTLMPLKKLIRTFAIGGGLAFTLLMYGGTALSTSHKMLGFTVACLGFLLGGLGVSFFAPLFYNFATDRSSKPAGIIVADIGAVNQALTFVTRAGLAWIAQISSLSTALVIPGVMLICVAFFASMAKE